MSYQVSSYHPLDPIDSPGHSKNTNNLNDNNGKNTDNNQNHDEEYQEDSMIIQLSDENQIVIENNTEEIQSLKIWMILLFLVSFFLNTIVGVIFYLLSPCNK